MGWSSYHANHYNAYGIDRKKECDAYFMEGLNKGHFRVEKSTMVGSTYYAAVRILLENVGTDADGKDIYEPLPEEKQNVVGIVFLTSTNINEWFNFSYKPMDETVGPFQRECPENILNLLTPTENEYALEWRKSCYENAAKKKALSKLPYGTVIKVNINGAENTFEKTKLNKSTKWVNWSRHTYIKTRDILSRGYVVV